MQLHESERHDIYSPVKLHLPRHGVRLTPGKMQATMIKVKLVLPIFRSILVVFED